MLRDFMIAATGAIQDSWGKLPALCAVALNSAKEVDATAEEVERDVSARALVAAEEKVRSISATFLCFCVFCDFDFGL